jgi:hypothetical protein
LFVQGKRTIPQGPARWCTGTSQRSTFWLTSVGGLEYVPAHWM